MTEDPGSSRCPRWGWTRFAVSLSVVLLLLPSLFAMGQWLRSGWGALTVAEIFWIGCLPMALYIGVRAMARRRHGECTRLITETADEPTQ